MNKDYTLPHETNDVEQPYNRQLLIFFCLFCFVSVENFSLMKTSTWPAKSCKYFDLCSALMDMNSQSSLTCHVWWYTGHPFIKVISDNLWDSHLLPSGWQRILTTWLYDWGLSLLSFEYPAFRIRGERSYILRLRCGDNFHKNIAS